MQPKHQMNFRPVQNQQQPIQKQIKNPNKTLDWSSINSNCANYQEVISPLNYKLSNPSSSLVMSSLSNIHEDYQNDVETTESTDYQNAKMSKNFHKRKGSDNSAQNDFYKYLMQQSRSESYHPSPTNNVDLIRNQLNINAFQNVKQKQSKSKSNYPKTIQTENEYVIPDCRQNYTLMNHNRSYSAEESLLHLEQSQEELTFLKYKLQQAYEKLERQIMNSYELEGKLQAFRAELQHRDELIKLQRTENQKLKFTLRAIMKSKSFMEEQMETNENRQKEKSQNSRENQLKDNLKLKLHIKDLEQTIKAQQKSIQQFEMQTKRLSQELSKSKKQTQFFKEETSKKDNHLQKLSQQLQQLQTLKTDNKKLLLKQTQYLNKINVLQSELRKVTDEKVTTVGRLRHEIAIVQRQNQDLMDENQQIGHRNFARDNNCHGYSPGEMSKRSCNVTVRNSSVSKNCIMQNHNRNNQKTPLIFDSEDEEQRQFTQGENGTSKSNIVKFVLANDQSLTKFKSRQSQQNKENIMSQNLQAQYIDQSKCSSISKIQKSVGKWKRAQSVSNNSSVYFQGSSNQQQNIIDEIQSKQIKTSMPQKECSTQKLIQSKLYTAGPLQSEDNKLSKYQQHKKNLQNELMNLEKNKRPTKEEREKIQKLQKQLYYIDSDIAGLKRKIRRKY